MPRLSVLSMLRNLSKSAPPPPSTLPEGERTSGSKANTTLRLDHDVRQFVDEQANHYGISGQAFISMMLRGLMLSSGPVAVEQTSLLESRFFELFEMHELAPMAISQMLKEPFNISLATLKRPDALLERIDQDVINFLSNHFGVRKAWLQGESDKIYSVDNFDKQLYGFGLFLYGLRRENMHEWGPTHVHVHFVMEDNYEWVDPESEQISGWSDCRSHAGFVLELRRGPVKSYKIIDSRPWGYSRTRGEMQTFLGFLEACRGTIGMPGGYDAWFLDTSRFDKLFNGELWPQTVIGFQAPGQAELHRPTADLYDLAAPFKRNADGHSQNRIDSGRSRLALMLECIEKEPNLTVKEVDQRVRELSIV